MCASQDYTGKCAHNTSAKALTHELLEDGYGAYKDIECVPAYLFCQYDNPSYPPYSECATVRRYGIKKVEIKGKLNSLLHIEDYAFWSFAGKITWSADTPNLKGVGEKAFQEASNAAPTVVLDNAPSLETIGFSAFGNFKGDVQLVGEFSRLSSIGQNAFFGAGNSGSRVDIKCSMLSSDVGTRTGTSSAWGWLAVGADAFYNFVGTHIEGGEGLLCSDYTTTTTTTYTTTTTPTATATTTTTTTTTYTTTTSTHTTTTTTYTTTTTITTTTKQASCYPRLAFAAPTAQPQPASPSVLPTAWDAESADDTMISWPKSSPVGEPVVLNGLPDDFFQHNTVRQKYTDKCLAEYPELNSNSTNPAALDTAALSYQLRWTERGTTTVADNNDPRVVGKPPPKGLVLSGETGAANTTKALTIAGSSKIVWLPQEVGNYTMWLLGGFFEARDPSLQDLFGIDSDTTKEDDQIVAAVWNFEIVEKQAFKVTSFARAAKDADGNPYSPDNGYTDIQPPTKDEGVKYDKPLLDCAVNSTYKVAPINSSTVLTTTQTKGSELQYSLRNAPNGFFVDGSNGEILAVPTEPTFQNGTANASGIVIAELVATDPSTNGGGDAVVQNISIRVRYKDEANPAYGPNRKGCKNGGLPVDDVPFDNHFRCDCSQTRYSGENCEKNDSTDDSTVVGVSVAAAVVLGIIFLQLRQRYLTKKDAKAALLRAFRAYGLLPPGASSPDQQGAISINSGDLVGVTMTPNAAFVGLDAITTLPLSDPTSDAVPLLDIAAPDASAGYVADQLVYDDNGDADNDGGNGEGNAAAAPVATVATTAFGAVDQMHLVTDDKGLSKFVAPTISLGKSTLAAKGLDTLLGIDPKTYMHVKRKVEVMLKEFAKSGTTEDNRNIATLLNGTYKHPPNSDGSPLTAEEIRGQAITMEELMLSDSVQGAGLELHHVLALRLYTTSTYRSINNPMRQSPPVLPHPFAATLYYISDALSKLRELQGKDLAVRNESQVFWRGMKDLQIADTFVRTGGSEMACMSTTSSRKVAEDFAQSKSPLLFKFVSTSFMSHGADISFLSVYPGEKEVLYPPLTYLRPIKLYKETIGGAEFQVAEVEPVFPK